MITTFIIYTYKAILRQRSLLAVLMLIGATFCSCEKDTLDQWNSYSLKVFNGINGGINVYANYNGDRPDLFRTSLQLANRRASASSNFQVETITGTYYPAPDTMPKDQPIIRGAFNLSSSAINTLYLIGDKSNADYLFSPLDHIKYTAGDSVTYLTFVNISNDQPVSVNIKDQAPGSLVSQLAYKATSSVIALPVGMAITGYDIEFRDVATEELMATFALNNSNPAIGFPNSYLYKNASIVLLGKRGQTGVDKMEAVRVSHD